MCVEPQLAICAGLRDRLDEKKSEWASIRAAIRYHMRMNQRGVWIFPMHWIQIYQLHTASIEQFVGEHEHYINYYYIIF